jgi:hypothetical protein
MAAISVPQVHGIPLPFGLGRLNWWVLGGLLILGGAGTLPVVQSSIATTRGFDTERIQAEQTALRNDIRLIENDIATVTNPARVLRRAQDLGFQVQLDPAYHVSVDVPGPDPVRLPGEYLPAPLPHSEGPAPWWQSLLAMVSLGF